MLSPISDLITHTRPASLVVLSSFRLEIALALDHGDGTAVYLKVDRAEMPALPGQGRSTYTHAAVGAFRSFNIEFLSPTNSVVVSIEPLKKTAIGLAYVDAQSVVAESVNASAAWCLRLPTLSRVLQWNPTILVI